MEITVPPSLFKLAASDKTNYLFSILLLCSPFNLGIVWLICFTYSNFILNYFSSSVHFFLFLAFFNEDSQDDHAIREW